MDGVCSDANEENDNIERTVRRRHSSILKPPRSPLQDLRGGNETVQESNAVRNRKSSRRVSFADTIKIFQSESNMKILKRSEIAEKEERENVLLMQNKNPEDNHCEITGMNTLLCAPIQIQMQQREFSIIEHNHGRKYGNDQTIISSDENQMDLTASHTVMIAKGVLDCTKSDKSIKIDTKSFLASLKFHTEDSKLKKELNVSMDQNTSPEKKINFSDLIKRLKVGKSKASPSKESDKENCELSVHAKESNNACSVNQIHLNVDENSSNRTRIFREQEDEMNFTQCHIANIQTLVPISNEASLREVKSNDITICGSDFMDLTINHTVQILPSANNLSEIEDQTQNVRMDVTTGYRAKSPGKKKNFENEWNATFQDSILNPENEIHITKSHITGVETHTVTQTCNQDVKSLAMISESVCTNLTVPDKKTVFSSSCSNAIELTKCLSSMTEEKNLLKHDSNYSKICPNSDAISLLEEKTFYSGEDSMDITKSHTVAIDNQIFKQDETNVQIAATPISEGGMMLQNHVTVAEDGKMDINCSSVPYVSKERLQRSLANSSSISLTDRKTKLFTNEDMNLNKCHTGNLGSQTPLASGNLAQENTRKCHFPSKSSSDEWEKMTKNHTEPSPQRIVVSENLTTTLGNEKDQVLKISHCLDKDFPQSVGCNQNIAKTHNIISSRDLDKQVALGNNRNTVSCEQSLFSATKPLFSSEGQSFVKNHNTTVNSRTVVSVPGENSKLPEPLRKSLGSPTPNCSHDKMIICSVEEQNMDLTKSHTVVIGFGPSEVHDIGKTNLESTNSQLTTISRQIADKFRECNKSPIKKPGVFISNDTEVLEDKTLQKSRFLNEKQNVKTWGRKSIGRLKIDKTILFSETDENDMDITRSYTVEINHRPLLDKHDSHLMPLAGTSETVLDTYGQDEMEMTRSHTTALEYKPVSPDEVTTRPIDKTVMFVDNHNDLEMTESHTVFIDYQAKEKTGFPVRPNFELPKIKNLGKPEVASTPDEKSVFFPDDGENDHPAAKGIQLSLPGEWSSSGSVEKAVTSIADDNMKVFKPMAWKNDRDTQKPVFLNEPQSGKSQRRKSLGLKNDKTLAFSENDKNDIDITQSCVVEINNKSALEDREDSHLIPMAETSKTAVYTCGKGDMDMTRSHTTALECKPVSPDEVTMRPIDKTVMFVDNHNDVEMTESHTVFIDYQAKERTVFPVQPNFELPKIKNLGKPKVSSTQEESVFFPEDGESEHDHPTAKGIQLTPQGEWSSSFIEKTVAFTADDNMEVSKPMTWQIQKPVFLKEPQSGTSQRSKNLRLRNDKTVAFSESDKNDMDITQSCMVQINNKSALKDGEDSHLMTMAETSKSALYTCGQDAMESTRSHTTALEYKPVSPDEITTRPIDKTIMFVDNHNDLEMTESHTVFIDYQAKERTVFPVRPDFELPKIKNLGKPKVASTPDEESVFFPEDGENDHPAAKGIQLSLPGEWSSSGSIEKAVTSIADDNMKVFKPMAWKNDRDTQKPVFLSEPQSGKSQRRKSLRLENDKTLAFSESDKNDRDITQSCVVEINNRSALEDQKDSHLMPMVKTSKTVLYTCGQDDMEMTRSHTTALECKPVSPDEVTTRPIDKTVMFVGNHNDLEVTKSHTVFIDCQAMEKLLQECPNFGTTEGNNLGVSFPKNDSSVQEITKKQALAIENKIIPHGEQLYHMVPFVLTNTLSGDQDEMESKKFHSTAVNEEVLEKIVDRTCTLGKAKMESYRIDRRNTDFMSSPATVTCRSSDNYSCLPNAVSFVDNLEGNIMSLCGKEKEKASNCTVLNELPYANNLAAEYYLKSEELPISVPFPLLEKAEVTQTNGKGQLDCVITLPKDQDNLVKKPQNTLANRTLVGSQDLGEMTRLNSKQVSFKLPNDQMEDFVDNAERSLKIFVDVGVSQPHLSTQLPPLTQEGQNVVNKDETILSEAGYKNLDIVTGNSSVTTYENESTMLNNEEQFTIPYKKELKENVPTAKCGTDTDVRSNSDLTKQVSQTHANLREPSDTVITSNAPSFSSTKPNLNNLNGKTEDVLDFQIVHIPPPPEQLLDLANQAPIMSTMQATDKHNSDVVSSNASSNNRNEENKNSDNGAEINSVPLMTIGKEKNKMRKCSLGIFLPRLPNKRNCSVTGVDDLEQNPANTTDLNHLETQPVFSKDSGIGFVAAKLNLSPSQYINEENLPIYPEINSSDSISIETEEKTLIETYQKEILPSANEAEETWTTQKRTWVQEEDDDTQNEKKIRKNEIRLSNTAQDQQIFDHHTEGDIDKNANSILMKSLSRTPSSCSSSLDSIKADGTSLDFSTHRNSQMESQFLRDTICEESLREKLKNGRITIREFFILLQVHILIQKPRQSNLPTKFTINTPPTPEDLMLSQYVYRPKIQIYKEDCEALCQKIEELKLSALNQDKLLIDVNKNLWEKMRHCSEEELKTFGIYLNKIKSRFTKITKVFTHQGKVALYSKLVQSAQNERKKLQERIHAIDSILKKIDNCLTKVEIETKYLEDEKKENPMREWDSEMKAAEKDLEQLKTEEEELQRNLLELAVQKKQTLAQIDIVQKQTNRTEELLDQLSLSEWDVIEWSDDQAVFTFLYDTIELTITFGEAEVGLPFLNKDYRKIADLNFQSVLDEDKAPPSSLLVHKLIFQYIKEQDSWKKKCTTQHQVPKMLQEISLVVSHCRLLGEEIEFLKRWGPNYNLMNIDVNNTELRLLFSSSAAFAKFEIMLSLSAQYPSVPLPFSIQNHLGNIGQDEIAAILFNVPLEDNYLKNVVKHISQDLLQDCRFHQ